jgi:hypothetical protein
MGEEYKVGPPVELRLKWTGYLWELDLPRGTLLTFEQAKSLYLLCKRTANQYDFQMGSVQPMEEN